MHLPRIVSILYTTVTLAVVASADIIGWSNKDCTGAEGLDDACAGECIDFRGRNSFQIVSGGTHCVTAFSQVGCKDIVAVNRNLGNGCVGVDMTGGQVLSIRCSSSNSCIS